MSKPEPGSPNMKVLVIPLDKCRKLYVLRHKVTGFFFRMVRRGGATAEPDWVPEFGRAKLFSRLGDVRLSQKEHKMELMTEMLAVDAYLQQDAVSAVAGEQAQ